MTEHGAPGRPFEAAVARLVWETKYRLVRADGGAEGSVADTWARVAAALAAPEPRDRHLWQGRFVALLDDFKFVPGGRILAGAGSGRRVTLFNCFVMGEIADSMDGILGALRESALTMQMGGGIGLDFSTLRPHGTPAAGVGAIASGPVSFMTLWNAMCDAILSTGARRGAMMATLRCDHPDIERFIAAKAEPGTLANFNLSVLVSDAFMAAARADAPWPLVFPAGDGAREFARVSARALWRRLTEAAYASAEPGVIFIDRVNRLDPLNYAEQLIATNPCGEIPLPAYGACDLGSINLVRFVRAPFTPRAALDTAAIAAAARTAVRLLDNVIDASSYPLPQQEAAARRARRVGLGITGLADALTMLNLRYDSEAGRAQAADVMRTVCHAAYRASVDLAAEKGPFPAFDRDRHLDSAFVRALPADIRDGIAAHGLRNSHLIAIAPTGTISLLANAVSSGIEPPIDADTTRAVRNIDGTVAPHALTDFAVAAWRRQGGRTDGLPPAFVRAADIAPRDHVLMQAALQPFVDNAISKTINVAPDLPPAAFAAIFDMAYDAGLKVCTAYRPNPIRRPIIAAAGDAHCCGIERESD